MNAGLTALPLRGRAAGPAKLAIAAASLLAVMFVLVVTLAVVGGASLGSAGGATAASASSEDVSPFARRDIPALYLRLYEQAAQHYGLDWAILAGVGKVECDHGRDPDPSCDREGAVNTAGAGGPMQFLASTWARYGTDGDDDGVADRWDPADAVYAAARYLRASGAPGDYREAIYAYNHAGWNVSEVEAWAARYRGSPGSQTASAGAPQVEGEEGAGADTALQEQTSTPVRFIAGARAVLSPADGHLALIPVAVPATVQAMLVAGNELQNLSYGPAGHPDPRGAHEQDCSSTVSYVLYRSGVRPIGEILRDNPLAADYVHWGAPGPGRWVSIYSTSGHTFVVIAGLRLDTSHNGTDVGPNRDEDGPRWRILDRIPTWADWSVRHPPGL